MNPENQPSAASERVQAQGILFPHKPTPPPRPAWTPGVGAAVPAFPNVGVERLHLSPIQPWGNAPDNLHQGRYLTISFFTPALQAEFGPPITQNLAQPQAHWARLNVALCPYETLTHFLHPHHVQPNNRLVLFSARNHDNVPQPCRAVRQDGRADFVIFIVMPETQWRTMCHFDVELMDVANHAGRKKFQRPIRYNADGSIQFV